MSDREAYVADKIRKLATVLLAAGGTYFLLRVLYRTAHGTQQLVDPELFAFLAIAVVAIAWIRSTQRVARRGSTSPAPTRTDRRAPDESAD